MRLARTAPSRSYNGALHATPLFTDIDGHWARGCILELASQKLVAGNSQGTFRPDAPMTRVEFATLMYWVFPQALPVREAPYFIDVPGSHWANKVVKWVYERGFFSGYTNFTFRPNETLTRSQAILVLVNGLNYAAPLFFQEVLEAYFDDAADVPAYAKGAIAAATLAGWVVNYPNVRLLRPNQMMTRGEVAALLCQMRMRSPLLPQQYVTWSRSLEEIRATDIVPFQALRSNARLVRQLQTRLRELQLYPEEVEVSGRYDPLTEAGLIEFCQILELPNRTSYVLDGNLAQILLTVDTACFALERARDRERVFADYLRQEDGYGAAKLAFLDKGIEGSFVEAAIPRYPAYLSKTPKEYGASSIVSVSHARTTGAEGMESVSSYQPFPKRGEMPAIDDAGLSFLHEDIQQACLCIGSFDGEGLATRWLGRQAIANVELWSATKIIPLLNVVSKFNSTFREADIDHEFIRSRRGSKGFNFFDLAVDMINYESEIGSSNSLAAMFKQFETPQNLENWLKRITGNTQLEFRGRYGEGAFIQAPELWDQRLKKVLLTAPASSHRGNNSVSTYDLTRLVTMLAWHPHLGPEARLPGGEWQSLESIIRAMGADSARYIDVAIDRLGLTQFIDAPVIISKLGFGRSGIRHRTELVYSAFVQFVDRHPCSHLADQPAKFRSLGMTLVAAKKLGNGDREAVETDARMAAEVTEILRRVVKDEWV